MEISRAGIVAAALLVMAAGHAVWIGLRKTESPQVVPPSISLKAPVTGSHIAFTKGPKKTANPDTAHLETWDQLLQSLANSPDGPIWDQTLLKLSSLTEAGQWSALISLHHRESDPVIRKRISEAISLIHHSATLDIARESLHSEDQSADPDLVCAIARALARRGQSADVVSILKRIDSTSDLESLEGLTRALSLTTSPAVEWLLCETARGESAINSLPARAAAAGALANFPSVSVTEVLNHLATCDPDKSVRDQAARSLLAIRTPE